MRVKNWFKKNWKCPAFLTGPGEIPHNVRSGYIRYIMLHTSACQVNGLGCTPVNIAKYTKEEYKEYGYSKIIGREVTIPNDILEYARNNTQNLMSDIKKFEAIENIIFGKTVESFDAEKIPGETKTFKYKAKDGSGEDKKFIVSCVDERKHLAVKDKHYFSRLIGGAATAGAGNWNWNTIHICYTGGICNKNGRNEEVDTRTPGQKAAMELIVRYFLYRLYYAYPENEREWLWIIGHNQVELKTCPCFWVPDWIQSIGIDKTKFSNEAILYTFPDNETPPEGYSRYSSQLQVLKRAGLGDCNTL